MSFDIIYGEKDLLLVSRYVFHQSCEMDYVESKIDQVFRNTGEHIQACQDVLHVIVYIRLALSIP
jgi:hypothetical protein